MVQPDPQTQWRTPAEYTVSLPLKDHYSHPLAQQPCLPGRKCTRARRGGNSFHPSAPGIQFGLESQTHVPETFRPVKTPTTFLPTSPYTPTHSRTRHTAR